MDLRTDIARDSFLDQRDDQEYRTVRIGNQIWMASNLNYACPDSWCYDDDHSNSHSLGRLYSFQSAQLAVPAGWRLPSKEDWDILVATIGGVGHAGTKLKARIGWEHENTGTDDYGFSLLPGGCRFTGGSYFYKGFFAGFWSSSGYGSAFAYNRYLFYFFTDLDTAFSSKFNGYSVRCVRDAE